MNVYMTGINNYWKYISENQNIEEYPCVNFAIILLKYCSQDTY